MENETQYISAKKQKKLAKQQEKKQKDEQQVEKLKKMKEQEKVREQLANEVQLGSLADYKENKHFQEPKRLFLSSVSRINQMLFKYYTSRNILNYDISRNQHFIRWLKYQSEVKILEIARGFIEKTSTEIQNSDVSMLNNINSNIEFFSNGYYQPRFTGKFISQIQYFTEQEQIVLYVLMHSLLQGYLQENEFDNQISQILEVKEQKYFNAFFIRKLSNKQMLLFAISMEKQPQVKRVPLLDNMGYPIDEENATESHKQAEPMRLIVRYSFQPVIHFIDIVRSLDQGKEGAQKFSRNLVSDVLYDIEDDMIQVKQSYRGPTIRGLFSYESKPDQIHYLVHFEPRNQTQERHDFLRYQSVEIKPYFLNGQEQSVYYYDSTISRWTTRDQKSRQDRIQYLQLQNMINKEILDQYADFSSAFRLIQLLQAIPGFKIRLTEEEDEAIQQNGNVLVIGRSGTGKTTCAILRLFSIEMLFRMRLNLLKKDYKSILKDSRFSIDQVDKEIGLHCIFCTASPVLTNEVRRYYEKLTTSLKQKLKERQQRKASKASFDEAEQPEQEQVIGQAKLTKAKLEKHMESELKGIVLEENKEDQTKQESGKTLEETVEEAEDAFDEEQELAKKLEKFNSLNDLQEEDFPGFFTIKHLIMLIDACLTRPFFVRDAQNKVVQTESRSSWANENKNVFLINHNYKQSTDLIDESDIIEEENFDYRDEEELEEEYQRMMQLNQRREKKQKLQKKEMLRNSFEVDFSYFNTNFWPSYAKRYMNSPITSASVWTEIYSVIKGSRSSSLYPNHFLPPENYQNPMYDPKIIQQIYSIFQEYESWKTRIGGYDLMDVVNYQLVQIKKFNYVGNPIHFMMIDEVQDLPYAMIELLEKITEQGLYFSGDTAQTIAQGVGFRFFDLKQSLKNCSQIQLTINFRSHNRILELANSIVTLLEIFFPKTIDRLRKERSNLDGPKPIVITDSSPEMLFYILTGEERFQQQNEQLFQRRAPLEFGCNQVIIVRDQESKKRIPNILSHALCLTVLESKGLEFDDVILYNFFTDSLVPESHWSLLSTLDYEEEIVEYENFLKTITKHEQDYLNQRDLEKKDEIALLYGLTPVDGKITLKRIRGNWESQRGQISSKYTQLCTELKQFYVAVTRPRNRLIIYDDNVKNRKKMEIFWKRTGTVSFVSSEAMSEAEVIQKVRKTSNSETSTNKRKKTEEHSSGQNSAETQMFRAILQQTSKEEWKKQGLKMFKNKYFQQAMKCFEKSQDITWFAKAQAYYNADKSSMKIVETEAELLKLKEPAYITEKGYNKYQLKLLKKNLKKTLFEAYEGFKESAATFEFLGRVAQAAQCYFSAKNYEKASQLYQSCGYYKNAAECQYILERFREAAENYEKEGDYIRILDCYDMLQEWDAIIQKLALYKQKIPKEDLIVFLDKFMPLALKNLVDKGREQEMEQDEEIEENSDESSDLEDYEREEEQKKQKEDQVKERLLQIQEGCLVSQVGAENDSQLNITPKENIQQSVQETSIPTTDQPAQIIQISVTDQSTEQKVPNIEEISFDILNQSVNKNEEPKQENKNKNSVEEMSFEFVKGQKTQSADMSFEKISIQNEGKGEKEDVIEIDFEDDEFAHSESHSIIQSIRTSLKENKEIQLDYSVIENNEFNPKQEKIVAQEINDIVIQDKTMRTVIKYISEFSDTITEQIQKLRSRESFLSNSEGQKMVQFDLNQSAEFLIDLDNIDINFVYLILDALEYFKRFKLCIFVCNRYTLSSKIGRYLLSVAYKHNILANKNVQLSSSLLIEGALIQRFKYLEKGLLSNRSINHILHQINQEFYRTGTQDAINTGKLDLEYYIGLVLLGNWKNIINIVDYEESLAIASSYADFAIFRALLFKNSIGPFSDLVEASRDSLKVLNYKPFTLLQKHNLDQLIATRQGCDYIQIEFEQATWDNLEAFKYKAFLFNKQYNSNNGILKIRTAKSQSIFKKFTEIWKYLKNPNHSIPTNLSLVITETIDRISGVLSSEKELKIQQESEFQDDLNFLLLICIFSPQPELQLIGQLQGLTEQSFLSLLQILQQICSLSQKGWCLNNKFNLITNVLFALYSVRKIKGTSSEICSYFGQNRVFVHRRSILIQKLLSAKPNASYFVDSSLNSLSVQSNVVIDLILQDIQVKSSSIIQTKINQLNQPNIFTNPDTLDFKNLVYLLTLFYKKAQLSSGKTPKQYFDSLYTSIMTQLQNESKVNEKKSSDEDEIVINRRAPDLNYLGQGGFKNKGNNDLKQVGRKESLLVEEEKKGEIEPVVQNRRAIAENIYDIYLKNLRYYQTNNPPSRGFHVCERFVLEGISESLLSLVKKSKTKQDFTSLFRLRNHLISIGKFNLFQHLTKPLLKRADIKTATSILIQAYYHELAGQTEQLCAYLLDFYQLSHKSIAPEVQFQILEKVATLAVCEQQVCLDSTQVFIPKHYLRYSSELSTKTPLRVYAFNKLVYDFIDEIIKHVYSLSNEILLKEIEEDILRIAQLLEFLVIHINEFTEEQTKLIKQTIKKILDYELIEDFSFLTKFNTFNDVLEVMRNCEENEKKLANVIQKKATSKDLNNPSEQVPEVQPSKELQTLLTQQKELNLFNARTFSVSLIKVTVKDCEKLNKQVSKIRVQHKLQQSQEIQSAKEIAAFLYYRPDQKNKIKIAPQFQMFFNQKQIQTSVNYQTLEPLLDLSNTFQELILNALYVNQIENPIDFHYLQLCLQTVQQQFSLIAKLLKQPTLQNEDNLQIRMDIRETEKKKANFEIWLNTATSSEKDAQALLKRQQYKEQLQRQQVFGQMIKKRQNLKKQKQLQLKAQILKKKN